MSGGDVIFLRFVSMEETLERMKSGILDDVVEPEEKVDIKIESSVREEYESDSSLSRFTIEVHGSIINFYTSGTPNDNLRCKFCGSDIPKNNTPVHIPEKIIRKTEIMDGRKVKTYMSRGFYFHCDFNCALAKILDNTQRYGRYEQNLKLIYNICHRDTDKVLRPSDPPSLLKINGGDMEYGEYKKEKHEKFHKTFGLIMENTRTCYGKY